MCVCVCVCVCVCGVGWLRVCGEQDVVPFDMGNEVRFIDLRHDSMRAGDGA